MFGIILLVIISIAFGFFSTQNSMPVSLMFGDRVIPGVPLFIVIGVTLLIGLLYSWIVSLVESLFFAMNLRKKDHTIADTKKDNDKLSQRLLDLEMENTRLQAELQKGTS